MIIRSFTEVLHEMNEEFMGREIIAKRAKLWERRRADVSTASSPKGTASLRNHRRILVFAGRTRQDNHRLSIRRHISPRDHSSTF